GGVLFACIAMFSLPSAAQRDDSSSSKISLDTSEVLFSTLTAINMCGYDQDLASSDPIRPRVRALVAERLQSSSAAELAGTQLCQYYRDKQQADPSRELAQYISLALNVSSAPEFELSTKAADLPPDASNLLGFLPLLKRFYDATDLHKIWVRLQPEYEGRIAQLQAPVSQLILATDLYVKMPISGYLGRKFVVYVEPMGASGEVNARNYGVDYFLVSSPGPGWLRTEQIRHTYLHFILDPLVQKRANQLRRLDPLLVLARTAPIAESFKHDAGLMVIESLIRAIEARTPSMSENPKDAKTERLLRECGSPKPEKGQTKAQVLGECGVKASMAQGYILTQYFYEQLKPFEAEPTGLKDAFGGMMVAIDLDRERKRIAGIQFASQAAPEVISASKSSKSLLDLAEERLALRDPQGAHRLAQQVLDQKTEDPARAMFILGRAATLNRDVEGARMLFERTLTVAKEPRMVAWSHIYLGRIQDLMCNRERAVSHYQAAITAGDPATDTKSAADKGIRELPPGCDKD
ncbi:MAG: tetratricopeptide repeat protein, partial [Terriglobales bacterium]